MHRCDQSALLSTLLLALLSASSVAGAAEPLQLQSPVPLASDADIRQDLITDCGIQQHLADAMKRELGDGIALVDRPVPTHRGRALQLEIVDAVVDGNWFVGHRQSMRTRGTLFEGGRKVASFKGERQITGELFRSCFNLNVGLKVVAYDIKRWLKAPEDGAHIGR